MHMASIHRQEVREYDFADRALALRQRSGLTQRELAAHLGVSRKAIEAWEGGLSYPGAERLKLYTPDEILGKHFSRFFTHEDIERSRPAELMKLAASRGRIEDEGWRVRLRLCHVEDAQWPPLRARFRNQRLHDGPLGVRQVRWIASSVKAAHGSRSFLCSVGSRIPSPFFFLSATLSFSNTQ